MEEILNLNMTTTSSTTDNYTTILPTTTMATVTTEALDVIIINNLTNLTSIHPHHDWDWSWIHTLKLFIFVPIVLAAILGNFLTLFIFITRQRLMRSPTHFFIANLSLADFLVGVLCLPFLAVQTVTGHWYFGHEFCFAYIIMHFWFCSTSIISTCAICIERYIGVKYPTSHMKIMSIPRVLGMMLIIWIYGGIVTLASLLIWPEVPSDNEYECKINQQLPHVIMATVTILYIPATIMIVLYWRIYLIATKHLKLMKKRYNRPMGSVNISVSEVEESNLSTMTVLCDDISSDGNSTKRISTPIFKISNRGKEMRADTLIKDNKSQRHIVLAKRLVFLVGILLISYVPYYTIFLIRAIDPSLVSKDVFNIFKWIRYFNSAINPFIYAFAVPAYRKAFVNIIVKRKFFS